MKFAEQMRAPRGMFIDPMNFPQATTSRQIRYIKPCYSTLNQKNYHIRKRERSLL